MPATNRDPENENLKPGSPATPRTGAKGSDSGATRTDPASGETRRADQGPNESAAEDRSPAAHKDRRARPD